MLYRGAKKLEAERGGEKGTRKGGVREEDEERKDGQRDIEGVSECGRQAGRGIGVFALPCNQHTFPVINTHYPNA
jgi:hypothetical protein